MYPYLEQSLGKYDVFMNEHNKIPTIEKPCIRQCTLNDEEICMGCFRTFNDMLKWHKSSIEEKKHVLQLAEERSIAHTNKVNKYFK